MFRGAGAERLKKLADNVIEPSDFAAGDAGEILQPVEAGEGGLFGALLVGSWTGWAGRIRELDEGGRPVPVAPETPTALPDM